MTNTGTTREERASKNDPQSMDMDTNEREENTDEGMIEQEKSEFTTNKSDECQRGLRERRVFKEREEKEEEVAVDEVDAPENSQLKVEEANFVAEKNKGSEGVQLLTYFEAPPHLRFNQYVLGSYRPPMDVHGCLAR